MGSNEHFFYYTHVLCMDVWVGVYMQRPWVGNYVKGHTCTQCVLRKTDQIFLKE